MIRKKRKSKLSGAPPSPHAVATSTPKGSKKATSDTAPTVHGTVPSVRTARHGPHGLHGHTEGLYSLGRALNSSNMYRTCSTLCSSGPV